MGDPAKLVLAEGKQKFLGPLAELRAKFAEQESEASLESVFFRATEETVAVEATATVY